jgi:hypothetical protein
VLEYLPTSPSTAPPCSPTARVSADYCFFGGPTKDVPLIP